MNERSQHQSEPIPRIIPLLFSEPENDEQVAVMARLETAAEAGDEYAFVSAYQLLDEEDLSAADFVHLIRLALRAGAHAKARNVVFRGAQLHPSDTELQKYVHVFAPPKSVKQLPRTTIDLAANRNWIRQHGKEYLGQWVAVKDGTLLGADPSLDALVEKVGDLKDVLLTTAY